MIDDDIIVIDDFLTPSYHKHLRATIEDVSKNSYSFQQILTNKNSTMETLELLK